MKKEKKEKKIKEPKLKKEKKVKVKKEKKQDTLKVISIRQLTWILLAVLMLMIGTFGLALNFLEI